MMPYMPRMTDRTLPLTVTAVMSPKPMVVTMAKQYHMASPRFFIAGSQAFRQYEKEMISSPSPSRTSVA